MVIKKNIPFLDPMKVSSSPPPPSDEHGVASKDDWPKPETGNNWIPFVVLITLVVGLTLIISWLS